MIRVHAAAGRQLPAMFPDRGKQYDQPALIAKLGLTQSEFLFLCRMIQAQIAKTSPGWPFVLQPQPKD